MDHGVANQFLGNRPQQTAKSYTYRMRTRLWYAWNSNCAPASVHAHTHSFNILLPLSIHPIEYTVGMLSLFGYPTIHRACSLFGTCNQQPTLACTVSVPLHHFQPYVCELLCDPFTCEFAGYFAVNLFP